MNKYKSKFLESNHTIIDNLDEYIAHTSKKLDELVENVKEDVEPKLSEIMKTSNLSSSLDHIEIQYNAGHKFTNSSGHWILCRFFYKNDSNTTDEKTIYSALKKNNIERINPTIKPEEIKNGFIIIIGTSEIKK